MSRPSGLQPHATDCCCFFCFFCTASDVVAFVLAVVVLASFVVWVLE